MAYAADLSPADPQGREGSSPSGSTERVTTRSSSVEDAHWASNPGETFDSCR